jgi:hypothetical protein
LKDHRTTWLIIGIAVIALGFIGYNAHEQRQRNMLYEKHLWRGIDMCRLGIKGNALQELSQAERYAADETQVEEVKRIQLQVQRDLECVRVDDR